MKGDLHRQRLALPAMICMLALSAWPLSSAEATAKLPEPGSPGAQILKRYCGDCHGPPSPHAHRSDEWANVIYRMQNHRVMRAMNPVPEKEYQQLLAYLKKHARP